MESKEKISKGIVELSSTVKHIGIIDMTTLNFKRLDKCHVPFPPPNKV